jgi:hypothetical protein
MQSYQVNDPGPDYVEAGRGNFLTRECHAYEILKLLKVASVGQKRIGAYPFFVPKVFQEGFFHAARYHPG